jgi:hypothetical protein
VTERHRAGSGRYWHLAAAVAIVGAVSAATAGGLGRLQFSTSVTSILPARSHAVATWRAEERIFGGTPIAVELTERSPNQLLSGTPVTQLARLEGQLARLNDVAVVYGPGTVLDQLGVAAGNLLASLTGYRTGLIDKAGAAAQAAGASVGVAEQAAAQRFDLAYGPVVVGGLPIGLPSLTNPSFGPDVFLGSRGAARSAFHWLVPGPHQADIYVLPGSSLTERQAGALVSAVRSLVHRAGLPAGVHAVVTGLPVLASALGASIVHELPLLGGLAILGVLASFVLTRRQLRWWRRLVPFGAGIVALALTLALLGWLGQSLSLGVLVFLPIMVGIGTDYPIYAASRMRTRWLVALAVAGAASCATLALSPLPVVRQLGVALALGLVLSAATGLVVVRLGGARRRPGSVDLGRAGVPEAGSWSGTDPGARYPEEPVAGRVLPSLVSPEVPLRACRGRHVSKRVLAVVAGAAAALGWVSLRSMPIEGSLQQLAAGVPGLSKALAAESALGVGGDLTVFVTAPDVVTPAMLRWYRRAYQAVVVHVGDQLRPVVSPLSLLSWLGPSPSQPQIDTAMSLIPGYLSGAAVSQGRHHAVLMFGAQVQNLAGDQQLVRTVQRVLPPLPAGAHLEITGLVSAVAQGYHLLGSGTLWTDLAGTGTFGAVLLALAWRRRRAVGRAVLAALLAVGWGALALRAGGVTLSPLAVAVGSVTTAIGGEFTFVAASWRRAQQRGAWSVVLRAACTSEVGFLVLAGSGIGMVRQFGLVLAGSIALALLAARVVMPALPRAGGLAEAGDRSQASPEPVAADGAGGAAAEVVLGGLRGSERQVVGTATAAVR